MTRATSVSPPQSLPVYRASDLVATDGANLGDPLSYADDLLQGDAYTLSPSAKVRRLSLLVHGVNLLELAGDTDAGTAGARIVLDCSLTFMSPDGQTAEALILVEVDTEGRATDIFLLPLAPLTPRIEYRIVGIDATAAAQKFAQVACVSFTRGTHITLATGAQRRVEELKIGDVVLTRDDGVQPIRWIGQSTLRAVGDFAPIRVAAGALNNENDLVISPDHRLFIYQRTDEVGAGRSELLIKARHLVNGSTVTVLDGGFVDYFQLLFDRHQIIYAEGIAAESMLIDGRTKPVLPDDLSQSLGDVIAGHSHLPHDGLEVAETLIRRPDATDLLRKASTR